IAFRIAHDAFVVAVAGAARPAEDLDARVAQPPGQRIDRGFVADRYRDVREAELLGAGILRHVGARHDLEARAGIELEESRTESLARVLVQRADARAEELRIKRGDAFEVAHPDADVFDLDHRSHDSTSSVCGSLPTTNTWLPTLRKPCLR